jgi:hypothetical protein
MEGEGDIVKIKVISSLLCCILLILFVNKEVSYADANEHIFKEILQDTKSQVVEYGVKVCVKVENNDEVLIEEILNKLKVNGDIIKDLKTEKSHYIEFNNEGEYGYLEYIYGTDQGVLNLEIIKCGHNLELKELEHRLKMIIRGTDEDKTISIYKYIKAKTNSTDTDQIAKQIIGKLKFNRAQNIDSIQLDNSVNITALTGNYEKIKNGDSWIDFNSAVCSYESGNYLIIGTPIIIKAY